MDDQTRAFVLSLAERIFLAHEVLANLAEKRRTAKMPKKTKGRWWWFTCTNPECNWIGIRYRNVKVCGKCGGLLKRGREANLKLHLQS